MSVSKSTSAVCFRVLVHVVNEVHAVDKTDILQSYVKVWYILL